LKQGTAPAHDHENRMIRAENLTRKFGDFIAVDAVCFEVGAGEIFAFLGPNGAGKTTTIKMLTTLLAVTSGKLEIDGLDPTRHKNEVRRRFGIVFQDPSLDQELTAWENMSCTVRSTTCPASCVASAPRRCSQRSACGIARTAE